MTALPDFDQSKYWIERHDAYRGDPRSVGNMAASVEENARGEGEF